MTGGELERCIAMFRVMWDERSSLGTIGEDEAEWSKAVEKLIAVPNWSVYYQDSLLELVAKVVVVAGVSGAIVEAASSDNPASAVMDAVGLIPDEAPDHPAALPLAFAMIGNLDAIARYSRSINDMINACREQNDIQALFDALSVDSIISTMPFFQAVLRIAQLSNDVRTIDSIFSALKGPHRHRLTYPELRWAEYLLRDHGAFQACTREEIYELVVVHLGIYDPAGAKKDPKASLFTLFRAWQKGAGIQNPRFGFSGKPK